MQELIRRKPGMISTRVGYSGGDVKNATYRNHGSRAEAAIFDPRVASFAFCRNFSSKSNDPTTRDGQGNDRKTGYPFSNFLTSLEQERVARETIADVEASDLFPRASRRTSAVGSWLDSSVCPVIFPDSRGAG
jgi:peptide-methionine (S)-S-oxide reductase